MIQHTASRDMAQVVSRPFLTDESPIYFQASPCGVCRGQIITFYWPPCKSECRVMILDADGSIENEIQKLCRILNLDS
jgi:cytidine deaminase